MKTITTIIFLLIFSSTALADNMFRTEPRDSNGVKVATAHSYLPLTLGYSSISFLGEDRTYINTGFVGRLDEHIGIGMDIMNGDKSNIISLEGRAYFSLLELGDGLLQAGFGTGLYYTIAEVERLGPVTDADGERFNGTGGPLFSGNLTYLIGDFMIESGFKWYQQDTPGTDKHIYGFNITVGYSFFTTSRTVLVH